MLVSGRVIKNQRQKTFESQKTCQNPWQITFKAQKPVKSWRNSVQITKTYQNPRKQNIQITKPYQNPRKTNHSKTLSLGSCTSQLHKCKIMAFMAALKILNWHLEFPTWRIIPFSKCLITMVSKSPKDRVVGPLPNGRFMAYKWGLLTTY